MWEIKEEMEAKYNNIHSIESVVIRMLSREEEWTHDG